MYSLIKDYSMVRVVLLQSEYEISGYLVGFDEFFNLTLNGCTLEYPDRSQPLGDIVLKGENVAYVRSEK